MSRNRVIYQSEALYAGPSPATGFQFIDGDGVKIESTTGITAVNQLQRIQNANYSFNINRQDINQFGELAAIDRVILDSPTVSLDFSYLLANFGNEKVLGFRPLDGSASCMSGILNKITDSRNYYVKTVSEGQDAVGEARNASDEVIAIGNGFLTSYSTDASVGGLPSVSCNVEALNMAFDSGTGVAGGFTTPAVDPENGTRLASKYRLPQATGDFGTGTMNVSVLRPGDITLTFKQRTAENEGSEEDATGDYSGIGASIGTTDAKIQGYSFSFDLSREPIQKLGSRFAFSREISFPVTVSCSIDALVSDITTGTLSDVINTDDAYDITVQLKEPSDNTKTVCLYKLKNAKLDAQSFSSSIGDNKSVTLDFSSQIGGPNQTTLGFFMSGDSVGLNQISVYDTNEGGSAD